jgi:hypothetical protein
MWAKFKAWLKRLFAKQPYVPNILPPVLRNDLIYCYYGSVPSQLEETKDHVTHHFVTNWHGSISYGEQILAAVYAGKKVILGAWAISQEEFTSLILNLKHYGRYNALDIIYPWDEPNLDGVDLVELKARIRWMRQLCPDKKFACIYADNGRYPLIEQFDYVGVDNYDKKERILTDSTYTCLPITEQQKLILVPGGWEYSNQDPDKFDLYAQWVAKVGIVMPFVWFDCAGQTTYLGIRSLPFKNCYVKMGKRILEAK